MATRMWWGYSDVEAEEEAATRKGPWTVEEDMQLIRNIRLHGEGRWSFLAKAAGLKRTGRSTRLRWVNSLRPDLKRGKITPEEERLIIELHGRWGNRWSHIARSVRGRTDNEIKNYCRTRFKGKLNLQVERGSSGMNTESHVHFKRSMGSCCSPISTQRPPDIDSAEPLTSFPTQNTEISVQENPNPDLQEDIPPQVIRSREGNYESGQPGEIHGPQINDAEQPSAALQEHLEGSHKQMLENSSPYNFSVGPLATLLDSSEFCLDGATQDGTIPPLSSYMVASPKAISETVSYLNCYSNVLWNMDEEDVRISPPSFYVVDSPDAFSDSESYLNCYSDVLWNMDQEDDGFNGSRHYAPCRNER